MRLTKFSYYALRVLLYLQSHPEGLSTIADIANRNRVSKGHLMKVVHKLGRAGFIETMRGRRGGLRIARSAHKIPLGYLLRETETAFESADPQMRWQALESMASSAILGEIL
ncbi:MAG TPA: Rrf2 family transcriptional regulator, partial [Burkholderiaceae bacterium]|nr:Rrf2 family transcriptional regulator [Burkholderiaceae bacterium]